MQTILGNNKDPQQKHKHGPINIALCILAPLLSTALALRLERELNGI